MNGICFTQNANNYPWKADLKVPTARKRANLICRPWRGRHRQCQCCRRKSTDLKSRYVYTLKSCTFDFEGPLYLECCHLDKFFIKGVGLQLRLFHFFRHEFVMMTAKTSPNYKVNILDAVFKAFKVKVEQCHLPKPHRNHHQDTGALQLRQISRQKWTP